MALVPLRFFHRRELGPGERAKENEKKKMITRVIMLAQCEWTPGHDRGKGNHFFSNTVYQLLNLFLPEVFFPQPKGKKEQKMWKFLSSYAELRANQYLHPLTLIFKTLFWMHKYVEGLYNFEGKQEWRHTLNLNSLFATLPLPGIQQMPDGIAGKRLGWSHRGNCLASDSWFKFV